MCPTAIERLSETRKDRGFTLIELLIVVAIIAILAAIAVPNFLEAQTRSKVARAEADMRTLATALEAYRVDTNRYPTAQFGDTFIKRLSPLTTPISYITSVPEDPFYQFFQNATVYARLYPEYCYAPGNIYAGGLDVWDTNYYRHSMWSLASRGPDRRLTTGAYCMAHPNAFRDKWNIIRKYDPTNGSVSDGEVFRLSSSNLGTAP